MTSINRLSLSSAVATSTTTASDGGIGSRLVALYFDTFEKKARSVISAAVKAEDDEKVVSLVIESRDLRGALENFAVINQLYVSQSIKELVQWRERQNQQHGNKASERERDELASDAVFIRASMQLLLHNDTWLNHWKTNKEKCDRIGLALLTPEAFDEIHRCTRLRARRWLLETPQPTTEGKKRVIDMLLEVFGQLSRFRFPKVVKPANDLLVKQLDRGDILPRPVEKEDLFHLRTLRTMRPTPVMRGSVMRLLVDLTHKSHKTKGLKRCVCEIFTSMLAPLKRPIRAASSSNSNPSTQHVQPTEESTLAAFFVTVEKWTKKPKHIPAATPLQTVLLCASFTVPSSRDAFHPFFDSLIKRLLEEKDRRMKCMYLECILHMLGFLLTHCFPQSGPSKYVPPPPEDARSSFNLSTSCMVPSTFPAAAPAPPPKAPPSDEQSPSLPPELLSKIQSVSAAIVAQGEKRQILGHPAWRSYALSVDIVVLLCRTRTEQGIALILTLLSSDPREVVTENTLIGLYSLLAVANLSQHNQAQGTVEEMGISQGVQLPWWALGVPHSRGTDSQPVRLRSPFTSFRPCSPIASVLWASDKCTAPSPSGLWAVGNLLLDTSTLTEPVIPPPVLFEKLRRVADELSSKLSITLAACERELCPSHKSKHRTNQGHAGYTEAAERDRPSVHCFRIALLTSVFVSPSSYTVDEYASLLARLSVHPQAELREAVTCTILPQLLLQRVHLHVPMLQALGDLLLASIDDSDLVLQLLKSLIRLFSVIANVHDPSYHGFLPLPISHLASRPLSALGTFRKDVDAEPHDLSDHAGSRNARNSWAHMSASSKDSETPEPREHIYSDQANPLVVLEAACVACLAVPSIGVRGKALALLHWIERASSFIACPGHKGLASLLESEVHEIEVSVAEIIYKGRCTGADWSESRDHRRVAGLLPLLQLEGSTEIIPQYANDMPACLRDDNLPSTPLTRAVLFSTVWPYCLAVACGLLILRGHPSVAIAGRAVAAKYPVILQRALESGFKNDLTAEDRRLIEMCQGYLLVLAAACEHNAEPVVCWLVQMLKSNIQDLADAASVSVTLLPRSAFRTVLHHLRVAVEDAKMLFKKEKNRRHAFLLRSHLIKAYQRTLERLVPADWEREKSAGSMALKICEWVDEMVDWLSSLPVDRMSMFDHMTILRCRADTLLLIETATLLLHHHDSAGRCVHQVDPTKRRKWLGFSMYLRAVSKDKVATSVGAKGRNRDDTFYVSAEALDALLWCTKERAEKAASAIVAGPLLVEPDMRWIDEYCAGCVSEEEMASFTTPVTCAVVLSFIHSMLASQPVVTPGGDDLFGVATATPSPHSSRLTRSVTALDLTARDSRSASANEAAFACLEGMLRCNSSLPGLIKASAALSLHQNADVAKLHLVTLSKLLFCGSSLPSPAVPMVLAATVSSLSHPDDQVREAAWKLVPLVRPEGSREQGLPPWRAEHEKPCSPSHRLGSQPFPSGEQSHRHVRHTIRVCASRLPEAGPVLVSLARERLPFFDEERRARLLSALIPWGPYLRLETATDVDDLLYLTKRYYPTHPSLLEAFWGGISDFELVISRLHDAFSAALDSQALFDVCRLVFLLVHPSHLEPVLERVVLLVQATPTMPQNQVAAALVFTHLLVRAHFSAPVLFGRLAPVTAHLLHAVVTVGFNHEKPFVQSSSRSLLQLLVSPPAHAGAFPPASPTIGRDLDWENPDFSSQMMVVISPPTEPGDLPPVHCARERVQDLLSLWQQSLFDVLAGPFVNLLVAAQPLGQTVSMSWVSAILTSLAHAETADDTKKKCVDIYKVLTKSYQAPADLGPLLKAFVCCVERRCVDVAARLCGAVTPLIVAGVAKAKKERDLDLFWEVASCMRVPGALLHERVAALARACFDQLPASVVVGSAAADPFVLLLRCTISRLYLQQSAPAHQSLVSLLGTLATMASRFLPAQYAQHCLSIIVAALLPEIRMRPAAHSGPNGLIAVLSASAPGPLSTALKSTSSTSDLLQKVTVVLAHTFWGGSEVRDSEVGELYLHFLNSEAAESDAFLPAMLQCIAHLLRAPALARIGASATSLAPILEMLPTLREGPAAWWTASCLSLAILRERPTAAGHQPAKAQARVLLSADEESADAAVAPLRLRIAALAFGARGHGPRRVELDPPALGIPRATEVDNLAFPSVAVPAKPRARLSPKKHAGRSPGSNAKHPRKTLHADALKSAGIGLAEQIPEELPRPGKFNYYPPTDGAEDAGLDTGNDPCANGKDAERSAPFKINISTPESGSDFSSSLDGTPRSLASACETNDAVQLGDLTLRQLLVMDNDRPAEMIETLETRLASVEGVRAALVFTFPVSKAKLAFQLLHVERDCRPDEVSKAVQELSRCAEPKGAFPALSGFRLCYEEWTYFNGLLQSENRVRRVAVLRKYFDDIKTHVADAVQ